MQTVYEKNSKQTQLNRFYGCVRLVDIFQFSNIYTPTPNLQKLATDPALQAECVAYVSKKETDREPFHKIFGLYCSLSHGETLQMFLEDKDIGNYNIDLRFFLSLLSSFSSFSVDLGMTLT